MASSFANMGSMGSRGKELVAVWNKIPAASSGSGKSAGTGAAPAQSTGGGAADIYSQLAAEQAAAAERLYQQQLAAAQEAYRKREEARTAAFSAVQGARQMGHDAGVGEVNVGTDGALQEAYILRQMEERNLSQGILAAGRSGGAAESTRLGLANSYGQNRGMLEQTRTEQLATLSLALQQGLAGDRSAYESARVGDSIAKYEAVGNIQNKYNTQLNAARQKLAEQKAALLLKQMK